jgi:hypothetical protein
MFTSINKAAVVLLYATAFCIVFPDARCPLAAASAKEIYHCADEPWKGNDELFVNDMLLRWRDDYQRLSIGEIRVKVHEILLGLEPPAEQYTIETHTRGKIIFTKAEGGITCTIVRLEPRPQESPSPHP